MSMKLRDYQIEIVDKGSYILKRLNIVYLSMEVRTWKTLVSFSIAEKLKFKNVLFITKKKAIENIKDDYNKMSFSFDITIINNESLHTIDRNDFDLLISDEHHRVSSFPKPNKTYKIVKQQFGHLPMILLSGTPATESASQWYHSFSVSNYSPFDAKNFYRWAERYVTIQKKYFGKIQVNDYSNANLEAIMSVIKPYLITYTQKEAGFESEITENILYIEYPEKIKYLIQKIRKESIIEGKNEVIIADTGSSKMSKQHQISNGTIIFESGNSMILDTFKAEFIKNHFVNQKIAIFYYYKKELDLLKTVFGENLTTDLTEFNNTNKNIALQQITGSEGISLKNANSLVYYSFGYSGKNYIQGRDRMTTIDRKENNVYFVFPKNSIDEKIYNVIKNKKTYTEKMFNHDFGISNSKKNN